MGRSPAQFCEFGAVRVCAGSALGNSSQSKFLFFPFVVVLTVPISITNSTRYTHAEFMHFNVSQKHHFHPVSSCFYHRRQ